MEAGKWSDESLSRFRWIACARGQCKHLPWLAKLDTCVCEKCNCRWAEPILDASFVAGAAVAGHQPSDDVRARAKAAKDKAKNKGKDKSKRKGQSSDSDCNYSEERREVSWIRPNHNPDKPPPMATLQKWVEQAIKRGQLQVAGDIVFHEPKPEEPPTKPDQPEEVVSDEAAEPSVEKGACSKYKRREIRFNTARRKWKASNEKFDELAKEVEAASKWLDKAKQKASEAKDRCEERLATMHTAESALEEAKKLHKTLVAASSSSFIPEPAVKAKDKEEG